ncbi:MAG: hypothetical protein Q8R28_17165, partial [Dehalococcoidia bacterium]|nr:hypothetical protein [Dehalococcoidia bacterium]
NLSSGPLIVPSPLPLRLKQGARIIVAVREDVWVQIQKDPHFQRLQRKRLLALTPNPEDQSVAPDKAKPEAEKPKAKASALPVGFKEAPPPAPPAPEPVPEPVQEAPAPQIAEDEKIEPETPQPPAPAAELRGATRVGAVIDEAFLDEEKTLLPEAMAAPVVKKTTKKSKKKAAKKKVVKATATSDE